MPEEIKLTLEEKERAVRDWVSTPVMKRITKKELYRRFQINHNFFDKVVKWEAEGRYAPASFNVTKTKQIMEDSLAKSVEKPKKEWKKIKKAFEGYIAVPEDESVMKANVVQALYQEALTTGNPSAAFRLAQIMKWVEPEKQTSVKVKVDANVIGEYIREAERWLRESGYRVPEGETKQRLLPQKVREDKGQD